MNDKDKKIEFIRETSVRLLAAYLIEDRIAWHKDIECFGEPLGNLIDCAIDAAEILAEKLEEKGY